MKRLILVVAVVGIVAGSGFYLSSPKTEPISPADSLVESAPVPGVDAPQTVEPIAAAREQPVKPARTRPAAESLPPRTATPGNAVLDAYRGGRKCPADFRGHRQALVGLCSCLALCRDPARWMRR